MEDLIGKQLGRYQVLAPLGQGGMAAVYKALQPGVDRYVALKILPRHLAGDAEFVGRFRQEAKVLASLLHPHILAVFDFGEADGYTYMVMPFVDSGTLSNLLVGEIFPLSKVRSIISQIGDALDYAHSYGIVHRDIKPSNVLIDQRGNCLLTDFGIAKILEGTQQFTRTGGILGTPAYMAPEQGLGQPIDARSDVYSLGVMLYEMVTGRVPFVGPTPMAVMFKHVNEALPRPTTFNPRLPGVVEDIAVKALAKQPEDRYQTVGGLVLALQAAIPEGTTEAPIAEPSDWETRLLTPIEPGPGDDATQSRGWRWTFAFSTPRGRRWFLSLGASAMALVVVAVVSQQVLKRVAMEPVPAQPGPASPATPPRETPATASSDAAAPAAGPPAVTAEPAGQPSPVPGGGAEPAVDELREPTPAEVPPDEAVAPTPPPAEPPAPGPPPPAPLPREPAAPITASLTITTDLAAVVSLDGEVVATLPASGTTTVSLPLGEHVVRAVSTESENAVWREIVSADDAEPTAVSVELRPIIEAEAARTAAALAGQRAREAEAARETFVRAMTGEWTEVRNLSGTYANTGNPYKMVRTTTLTLYPDSDGSLAGKLHIERVFSDSSGGERQDVTAELKFVLAQASVSQVTLTAAQERAAQGWVALPAARISAVTVQGTETIRLTLYQKEGSSDDIELRKSN